MKVRELCALLLAAGVVGAAHAQPQGGSGEADPRLKEYKCSRGSLRVRLESGERGLVAIVLDDKLYTLATVPWKPGDGPMVTWGDGTRMLTWSPGVVLRWTNGSDTRVCVNGVMHHGDADAL